MKRKILLGLSLATVLTLGAGASLSQINRIDPQISPQLRPINLSKFMQAGKLSELRLVQQDKFNTLTDLDGKLFAAAPRTVAALGEKGEVLRRYSVSIDKLSISKHTADQLLLGDGARKILIGLNVASGQTTELLRLDAVTDPNASQEPESALLKSGELTAVASNGKEVFVAMEAGFSSAIFKIDLATKRIVSRGWAPGAEMDAMAFFQSGLYVLTGNGSQVARYTDTIEKTHDKIELPQAGAKGLALRDGEIHVLTDGVSRISKYQIDKALTNLNTTRLNVDVIRRVDVRIPKIDWSKLFVKHYAVLICGDLAENFAGECFWNDTVWMYKALLNNGYKPENIFVLYGDGADYASANAKYRHPSTVTDFPASPTWVNKVFDGLKNGDAANSLPKLDGNDTLFVWTFDHGGGGMNATLSLRGGSITDTDFSNKLNAIPYATRAIFMQQCRSGGFIDNLQNSKTFIATACRFDENARPADTEFETVGGRQYSHGEFNYHITSALDRVKPTGGAINADTNSDGKVSVREMSEWNRTHENLPENPQTNDGGPGNGFLFPK
ncbi:C13 family peptidase [Armatimonas sp.]|uniref:C13 family peptidase n=1 Tax=Armatimonas sp. TaxID=1872638 RepID=UPI00286A6418|nr:C13 family peptidase [Armatimonas sp.]